MPATHSSGRHDQPPPKSTRRPLQPKNHRSPSFTFATNPKPINPPPSNCTSNKENQHFYPNAAPNQAVFTKILADDETDASLSLADELSAVREKLERQRIDREKSDKLLRERASALDLQLKEILNRGEIQKQIEIELDRLYRLKEIRLACTRISQIRSLRDKEEEKKMKKQDVEKIQGHEDEEEKGERSSSKIWISNL